jgi:hypothetical protein
MRTGEARWPSRNPRAANTALSALLADLARDLAAAQLPKP